MRILFLGIDLGLDDAINGALIWIASGLYKCAIFVFRIFLILANGLLLEESSYKIIVDNCYVILGVVMLFIVAFYLLKAMVNADDQTKSTTNIRKMIINLVTSAILLAIIPSIFSFLYSFQSSFTTNYNVIGKFFGFGVGKSGYEQGGDAIQGGSNLIVNSVWLSFFNVKSCGESDIESCYANAANESGATLIEAVNEVNKAGDFNYYVQFSDLVSDGKVDFNFLLSLVAGILLCYIGISYCFDMGLRLVKLVFYQLIAPIPIMFRIIPEGKFSGTFNQWLKITLTCYLEVFIRIFILYFCIYLCLELLEGPLLSYGTWKYGLLTYLFTKAFVLMGIMTFMKQAPKLISEITGIDSGNMSLGIKDKFAAGGGFAAAALAGGAITAGMRNLTSGAKNTINKFKDVKGKTGKDKAKAIASATGSIFTGLGSVAAGALSGGARAGKNGWGAKSWKDMTSSAGQGAKAAVDARNARADRKLRYQANGNNWFTRSAVGGQVMDKLAGMGDWATGGADRFAGIIKTADEMTGAYDAIEAQAEKIYAKHKNNVAVKANVTGEEFFKGPQAKKLFELYQDYADSSLAVIEADLERMRQFDPTTLVDKKKFMDKKGRLDTFRYNQALDTTRIQHANKVANLEEMFNQLKKESIKHIAQQSIQHASGDNPEAWAGIKVADMMGVVTAASDFESKFKANGNRVVDPIKGEVSDARIDFTKEDVVDYMDTIAKAYKSVGHEAKTKSADIRLKAEQRKKDK